MELTVWKWETDNEQVNERNSKDTENQMGWCVWGLGGRRGRWRVGMRAFCLREAGQEKAL